MKARILIVDDNVNLTTLLAKTLARFGYDPYTENSSVMAFSTIQKLMPDVILLDVMMPEKDGGKVLAEITSDISTSKIPVILLTGLAREAQGLANMFGLTSQVIGKPVELQVLLAEIEGQLAMGRSYNEQRTLDSDRLQEEELIQHLESAEDEEPFAINKTIPVEETVPIENPFFAGDSDRACGVPSVRPQPVEASSGGHHTHPDFKEMFSKLPPLEPKSGFGSPSTPPPVKDSPKRERPMEGCW